VKISIITVCYNSGHYIKDAIESVLNQSYQNIEYIIIDGGSEDNTGSIVKKYREKIAVYISEKDNGIYDAMNKGISLSSGEYVCLLNSDDFYINNSIVEDIVQRFRLNPTDSLYADLIYVDNKDTGKQVRYWKSGEFFRGSFRKGWHPPHPTFIVKRSIYEQYGYFDLSYKLAADFELMLRFLEKNKISTQYFQQPIIKMRLGGATNKSLRNIYKQNIECYKAFKSNSIPVSFLYPLYRILPKIMQYFRKSK